MTLYKNVNVYTGTGRAAEAFAVEDGRFVIVARKVADKNEIGG